MQKEKGGMKHMVTSLIRYGRLHWVFAVYALKSALAYSTNFIIQIIVEVFYVVMYMLTYSVIFANNAAFLSLSREQVYLLMGLNIVTSQTLMGIFYIFNMRLLAARARSGDLDGLLLKPINTIYHLTAAYPYHSAFISMVPGAYLIYLSGYVNLSWIFSMGLIQFLILFIAGQVAGYSLLLFTSSLSMYFLSDSVAAVGQKLIFVKDAPHTVYTPILRFVFFSFIPLALINSIPSFSLFGGVGWDMVVYACGVAFISFVVARYTWHVVLDRYQSASS
jgi:ABC-type uncharacterized transport system permease subunit